MQTFPQIRPIATSVLFSSILLGVLVWTTLYLRHDRQTARIPLRR